MYPFPGAIDAYEAFWRDVAARVAWLPRDLWWTDDVQASWIDPEVVVSQACGWPVATTLAGRVRVVGAFEYDVPVAEGHRYRSILIATRAGALIEFEGARAAVNGEDSLSGWVSLQRALGVTPTDVVWTGAHKQSLIALQRGDAEIACIDSVSLAHIRRDHPELLERLHTVGVGPLIPSHAIVLAATASDEQVDELRGAFAAVTAPPELFIRSFIPLGNEAYDRVSLAP